MTLKKKSISIFNKEKEVFEKISKKITFSVYSFILFISFSFICLEPTSTEAAVMQNDKLIERISKDYTNKFCNSIAFGLSKDSAMNFANKENNMIFKKKKGWDELNQDLITNSIAVSVVENCGYLIGLKSEEGIKQFAKDYDFMKNS